MTKFIVGLAAICLSGLLLFTIVLCWLEWKDKSHA